jgi:hypothetical protein
MQLIQPELCDGYCAIEFFMYLWSDSIPYISVTDLMKGIHWKGDLAFLTSIKSFSVKIGF